MLNPRSLRSGTGLLAFAAIIFLLILNLGGCSDEDSSPTALEQAQAPTLPDPEILEFDFSFFDSAAEMEKNADGVHDNFVNAYLRAVVLSARWPS